MALRDAVSSTDAVSAIEQAESNKGNNGVPWVGGGNAGGSGQSSIKVVGDVTRAGYNLLNGRSATDTSSIARSACGNRLTCQTWPSPQAAADSATRVLGEREQRTCENRSDEHTSELQSLMRIPYAVFCLKKKTITTVHHTINH